MQGEFQRQHVPYHACHEAVTARLKGLIWPFSRCFYVA
jgi:hypothetical protein